MTESKWRSKSYTIVGWLGFSLFLIVIAIDAALAILHLPTFSNYITARAKDQPLFMWIIIVVMAGLAIHWFVRFKKK